MPGPYNAAAAQREALRKTTKPLYEVVNRRAPGGKWERVPRPTACPNCSARGLLERYRDGESWCYDCGWRSGAGMRTRG